jgi:hypothetical protein
MGGVNVSILQNAIDSIQIGVEDFQSADERRQVSALRNIVAGMLLLMKQKLCDLSPAHDKELLIKKEILPEQLPDGTVVFKGKGKKTVDVLQIEERLSSLNVVVDWKRLNEITKLRNDLEHYYTDRSSDAVREIVAKSFLILRDFAVSALDEDPIELFGADCWSVLLETNDVYAAEEKACHESIQKINWKYSTVEDALKELRCPACHSSLIESTSETDIYPNIGLRCKSCSHDFQFEEVIEECISDLLSGAAHHAIKDGGDSPYGKCPHCFKDTYIFEENCCVACEDELEFTECIRCETSLGLDDQFNDGLCGYCQYVYEKSMDD